MNKQLARAITVSVIAAVIMGMFVIAAWSQQVCRPHHQVIEMLEERFSEQRASSAIINDTTLLQIYIDPEDESWTALIIYIDGRTCIVATGTKWEWIPLIVGDPV